MTAPPAPTLPLNNYSAFKSVPLSVAVPPVSSGSTSKSTSPGSLRIAANQRENFALARQLANHQQYLCYELPRYYRCGHPAGTTDVLLSQKHINKLGYGIACDSSCAVVHSRRTINTERCPWCVPVDECFSVVMRHSCGHLAGVFASSGRVHSQRIGAQASCDPWCRAVQVNQEIGGACVQCTWGHCCMIWEKYRCGHRGGVLGHHVVGPHHILKLGSDLAPCGARCNFRHREREVGDKCLQCKPMCTSDSGGIFLPRARVRW